MIDLGVEDLLLPAEDTCASAWCGKPAAEHADSYADWEAGAGPLNRSFHSFIAPDRKPIPEAYTEAFITTQWVCPWCGENSDVWGVAGFEWMDCDACGKPAWLS